MAPGAGVEEVEMGGRKRRVLLGLATSAMALTMTFGMASLAQADIGAPPAQHQGFVPSHAWFSGGVTSSHQFAPAHSWLSGGIVPKTSANSQVATGTAATSTTGGTPVVALILGIGLAGMAGVGLLVMAERRRRLRPAVSG